MRGVVIEWDPDLEEGLIRTRQGGVAQDVFVDRDGLADDLQHPGAFGLRSGIDVEFEFLQDWKYARAVNVRPVHRRTWI